MPVIHCSIGGTRIIGSLTAGNKNELLVPNTCTDQELKQIRNSLPDEVKVKRVEEKLSALGNCVACNDYIALIHSDLDKETEEIIADTFGSIQNYSGIISLSWNLLLFQQPRRTCSSINYI
ncbi:unnamed protein product [Paramecium primaurelia]|uniref:Eukaryotic translation initiation factor 6 n=1 Tax=Paramecium primaurelia TaxID=5886 RepID=A0A8S1PPZ0_PARPR|nr:unnamed protein product [Paramecium primaurelia]